MTTPSPLTPALFVGHGSPLTAFEEGNPYVAAWKSLGERLGKPKAILAISGHWQTRGISALTGAERPATVHDFYGFPEELYRFHYEAPGSPELAARTAELISPAAEAPLSHRWGLDHGTWTVLMHMYPQADVPVVQLSLDMTKPPEWHVALGERLKPLREEGVMVMGTGNIVHNLAIYDRSGRSPPNPVAEGFRREVQKRFRAHDKAGLAGVLDGGPAARLAQPTPDHFLPVLYLGGLQQPGEEPEFLTEVTEGGGVDMTTVVLGA